MQQEMSFDEQSTLLKQRSEVITEEEDLNPGDMSMADFLMVDDYDEEVEPKVRNTATKTDSAQK